MFTLVILSFALAADAFAVSVCRGAQSSHRWRNALWTGFIFGIVQGGMALLGAELGNFLENWKSATPWVAFVVLAFLGYKMITAGLDGDEQYQTAEKPQNPLLALAGLLMASVATSIDAAAAGITLPLLGLPLLWDALVIASVTGVLCVAGYHAGARIGAQWGKKAEVVGGIILVLIGIRFIL